MNRPGSVTLAIVLIWIGAIAMLISALTLIAGTFGFRDPTVQKAVEDALVTQGLSAQTENYFYAALWTAAIIMIVSGIVRIILAIFLGRGHNWARVVITVFVAIGMLSSLSMMFAGGWNILIGLGALAIEIVVLWLMWNARASLWFAQARVARS